MNSSFLFPKLTLGLDDPNYADGKEQNHCAADFWID